MNIVLRPSRQMDKIIPTRESCGSNRVGSAIARAWTAWGVGRIGQVEAASLIMVECHALDATYGVLET